MLTQKEKDEINNKIGDLEDKMYHIQREVNKLIKLLNDE